MPTISGSSAPVRLSRVQASEELTCPVPGGTIVQQRKKMFDNIENSVWHAFDYSSVETGRLEADKGKLKVGKQIR